MIFVICCLCLVIGIPICFLFSKLFFKKSKNIGTLMIINTEEGLALFVELNQEIKDFANEKTVTLDVSRK